ncbi:MAG TPA: hypothetical protein VIF32_00770 [Gemmatimonadaceae bacterium]|jgi:hypothetical protein
MLSTRRVFFASALILVSSSEVTAQQTARWRWSLAGGPSIAFRNGRFVPQSDGDRSSFQLSKPIIRGAEDGVFNAMLGASRSLAGSALITRVELLYNRAVSSPRPSNACPPPPFICMSDISRPALRDETFAADLGLEWDALPSRAWSPYLLTTLGVMNSRLGWSRDSTSRHVDENKSTYGAFAGVGAGVRHRIGKHEYFMEYRRHHTWYSLYGSTSVPFSIGFRF